MAEQTDEGPARPRSRRNRRRRRGSGRVALARRVARDMQELARLLARDPAICTDGPPGDDELEIVLQLGSLGIDGSEDREEQLAGSLLEQLTEALHEASREEPPLEQGQAWCFLCRQTGCLHSLPPDREHVFAGYSATGVPRWESFATRCLTEATERAGRLYGPRAEVVALVHRGEELCRDLLPDFGRASDGFRLLAQLDVGFLELHGERLATSFQAIRLHPRGSRPRVVLHSVGLTPRELEVEPEDMGGGLDPGSLRDLLRSTAHRLDGLLLRGAGLAPANGPPPPLEELAEGVLSKLKGGLERMSRQRGRRTRHADERRQDRGRPVEQGLRDAMVAGHDDILLDRRRGTFVILGPRGRVHVFSPSAQLVTSLKLDGDAVRRRVDRGRWKPAPREDADAFRSALGRLLGAEADAP